MDFKKIRDDLKQKFLCIKIHPNTKSGLKWGVPILWGVTGLMVFKIQTILFIGASWYLYHKYIRR